MQQRIEPINILRCFVFLPFEVKYQHLPYKALKWKLEQPAKKTKPKQNKL